MTKRKVYEYVVEKRTQKCPFCLNEFDERGTFDKHISDIHRFVIKKHTENGLWFKMCFSHMKSIQRTFFKHVCRETLEKQLDGSDINYDSLSLWVEGDWIFACHLSRVDCGNVNYYFSGTPIASLENGPILPEGISIYEVDIESLKVNWLRQNRNFLPVILITNWLRENLNIRPW